MIGHRPEKLRQEASDSAVNLHRDAEAVISRSGELLVLALQSRIGLQRMGILRVG
jgi:hypothetical protein